MPSRLRDRKYDVFKKLHPMWRDYALALIPLQLPIYVVVDLINRLLWEKLNAAKAGSDDEDDEDDEEEEEEDEDDDNDDKVNDDEENTHQDDVFENFCNYQLKQKVAIVTACRKAFGARAAIHGK